jgi:hypothetical protein
MERLLFRWYYYPKRAAQERQGEEQKIFEKFTDPGKKRWFSLGKGYDTITANEETKGVRHE